MDDEHLAIIGDRIGADLPAGIKPTKLYTHNVDVDSINYGELGTIAGGEKVFGMHTKGRANLVEILKKSCLAAEQLRLKVGAEVMFIKNDMELIILPNMDYVFLAVVGLWFTDFHLWE
jgi:hypothetical protein